MIIQKSCLLACLSRPCQFRTRLKDGIESLCTVALIDCSAFATIHALYNRIRARVRSCLLTWWEHAHGTPRENQLKVKTPVLYCSFNFVGYHILQVQKTIYDRVISWLVPQCDEHWPIFNRLHSAFFECFVQSSKSRKFELCTTEQIKEVREVWTWIPPEHRR